MNYIGSKHSLMDFLTGTIGLVAGSVGGMVFADLFAGTGAVGSAFREKGCRVIANDIQYYSFVLNKHLIEGPAEQDVSPLGRLSSLPGVEGFIYQSYCAGSGSGRNYFTDANGRKCDAIRLELERLRGSGEIDEAQYFCFLASLIDSMDRCANTASVYGAFLKHIKASAAKPLELRLLPVPDGVPGRVYNEDIGELITRISGDILYLDPPYNARQYCTNYHVLETIARYDSPALRGKTGLREYSAQKSGFCSSRTVAAEFENVVKNADFRYIFLSYNNEGLMPFDVIRSIMEKYGRYEMFTTDYKRFKADTDERRSIKGDRTVEYLHCLIKG